MPLSVLLYAGLAAAAAGALSVAYPLRFLRIRTRSAGALVLAAGVAMVAIACAWPASAHRAASQRARLDAVMPEWQFGERHETRVHASPARVMEAARSVTPDEIRLFATLTGIRALPWRIVHGFPPRPKLASRPLLETFLRSGFVMLAEAEDELVFAEVGRVRRSDGPTVTIRDAAEFRALEGRGVVKVAANLRVEREADGWVRLTTETRVAGADPAARRAFAAYWRLIYPGSSLLRTTWLAAIKARAEAAPAR